ncbi:MAG: Cof-type HAD-IIB family hydrolase [Bacillus sp. (in: Bacteria)]|nr:Cof-type HAD-IIB family hydrolase [Bacillus sp. (in: firmicutes)]
MNNYKVLFLDIDGTILTPDDQIEASTRDAISQVQGKGVEVFLATGRPIHEIKDIIEKLKVDSYIGYNGAYASYNGNDIVNEAMDGSTVDFFLETAKKQDNEVVLYTREKNLFTNLDSSFVKQFIDIFHLRENELFDGRYRNDVLGMTLMNVSEEGRLVYEKAGDLHLTTVNVDGVREHAYDVIRDSVNKGFAVNKVLDLLGVKQEQAIAFGDGMNDKEMLQLVGEGFAMGNAHPDLLAYANRKTTSVTDSGIYNGLKSLGLVD